MEEGMLDRDRNASNTALLGDDVYYSDFQGIYDYLDFLQNNVLNEKHKGPAFKFTIIIINSLIIMFSVLGNFLVIITIIRNKKMHSAPHLFLGNLAISDLTVCILCLPFTLAASFQNDWTFGSFMCNLVPTVQTVSVCVSTMTLTFIAVDRYYVVVRPMKSRLTPCASLLVILTIWMISTGIAIPVGIFSGLEVIAIPGLFQMIKCSEQWKNTEVKGFYDIAMFLLQCVFPLMIIGTAYVRILLHMNRRVVPGVRTKGQQATDIRKKMKTTKILLAVIAIFAIGWLPLNIWILLSDFNFALVDNENMSLFYHICHTIAMTTTCVNPFFYGLMNDTFRAEYVGIFNYLALCRRKKQNKDATKSLQTLSISIENATRRYH
ncbi:prolactin-releasing peptide receptor-like [Glandiceps talaboti]